MYPPGRWSLGTRPKSSIHHTRKRRSFRKVPLVDLKIQYLSLKEQIFEGIEEVVDSMYLFLGKNVQNLESEYAQFCDVQHAIGVSDGTTALHLILRAMEIGPGDEVITVSHTFIATAEAIHLAGRSLSS